MYIGAFMYDVITEFFQIPPHPCLTSSTFLVAPAGWRRIAGSFIHLLHIRLFLPKG